MSDIMKFADMNHVEGILYIVAAILVAVALIKAIAYLVEKMGIKTATVLREEAQDRDIRELRDRQDRVFADLDDIKNIVTTLSNCVQELKFQNEKKDMKRMRRAILNFSDSLRSGNLTSKESIDDILEIYDDYEEYIKRNNFSNGRMDIAIAFIKDYYQRNF